MPSKISVRFKFFASSRNIVGSRILDKEIDSGLTTKEVVENLMEEYPELKDYKNQIIIAVNKETGKEDKIIKDGDEIAILPPVSGG